VTDASELVERAVTRALADPQPNPYAAALIALYRDGKPQDADVQVAWDQIAEHEERERRVRLEQKLSKARSRSRQKRLRARLKQRITAPRYSSALRPRDPDTEHMVIAESYTVDTPPEFFLQRHKDYKAAIQRGKPVMVWVHRSGEPAVLEHRVLPKPIQEPRRRSGGPPAKVSDGQVIAHVKKYSCMPPTIRAKQLGLSYRRLSDRLKKLGLK